MPEEQFCTTELPAVHNFISVFATISQATFSQSQKSKDRTREMKSQVFSSNFVSTSLINSCQIKSHPKGNLCETCAKIPGNDRLEGASDRTVVPAAFPNAIVRRGKWRSCPRSRHDVACRFRSRSGRPTTPAVTFDEIRGREGAERGQKYRKNK